MSQTASAVAPGSDALAIAASARRPERFAVVFDRHFPAIHRYLARRAGREVADDLASLVFTVAFERRGSFDPSSGDARPWLYGIATNLLREHWRREQRSRATIVELHREPPPATRPDDDLDLGHALASLDPEQRDVLLLFAWGELTYEEISASLGIPIGTVRSRLARARAHIRAELDLPTSIDTKRTRNDR